MPSSTPSMGGSRRSLRSSLQTTVFAPCALSLALIASLACGPTEGFVAADGAGGGAGTATVSVLVADAPSDAFLAVNVTVMAITLLGGPSGPVTIFEGLETFDLLALRDVSEIFAISDDVPAGTYSKIRLTLADDGLELVIDDGQEGVQLEYPSLPGNGSGKNELDLLLREPIVLNGGDAIALEIDLDVDKSLPIHQTGDGDGKWPFRPVVFVRVIRDLLDGRLVRLNGFVERIDLDARSFSLCRLQRPLAWLPLLRRHGAHPASIDFQAGMDGGGTAISDVVEIPGIDREHPRLRCVAVHLLDDASIFDTDGTPIQLRDVTAGERATLVGRLRPTRDRRLELFASLMGMGPPGTFEHRIGTVVGDFDANLEQFGLELASGQGDLTVQVFPTTKLFERGGMAIGTDAIMPGAPASVTGVIVFSSQNPARMNAAVLILDLDDSDPVPLPGTITQLNPGADPGECAIDLDVAGSETGVAVGPGTVIFLIDPTGSQTAIGDFDDLAVGDIADVYGRASDEPGGCYRARVILAFPPAP